MTNPESKATSSEAMAAGPDWTSNVPTKENVEQMLKIMTGLPNIQVRMSEIKGTQYFFQSMAADSKEITYYLWNTSNEDGGKVTYPTKVQDIENQIKKDITKVKVTPLPDLPGSDEE
ncbi:hypothetical protein L218DRAFT_1001818 [Marasmius fiardii PR-910]|nr:hypothetical protein L218DRAFT_1001818 [Marasmius fiardii PR-910]